jgi:anti-sigma factor ChrR (cupin superfamily)
MQASHSPYTRRRCKRVELACAYALQVLPTSEVAAAEAHIAACPECQRELESLRPVVDSFVSWPTDVLRPTTSLQARLALRIAEETGKEPMLPPARRWSEPEWEQVAPGIECKLLATDAERHRVSMLVHLALGASYPAHTQAGVEGSTRASSSRATTTTVRLERATSASGARPAAPVFSSPAPRMFCADYGEPPHLG